jgi:hypothetical protein
MNQNEITPTSYSVIPYISLLYADGHPIMFSFDSLCKDSLVGEPQHETRYAVPDPLLSLSLFNFFPVSVM